MGVSSQDSGDTAPGFVHLCRRTGVKPWAREKGRGREERRRGQGSKGEKRGIKGEEDSEEEERMGKGRKREDRKGRGRSVKGMRGLGKQARKGEKSREGR